MLANLLIRFGFSRDDLIWFWLQLVAVAGLISSNVFDVPYWMGYLGIPLSPTALHWIFAGSALVLWMAGKYNTSPLPSGAAMKAGIVPNSPEGPKVPMVLLVALLGGGLLGAGVVTSGCASSNAIHAAVVVDNGIAQTLHAVKQDELAAYHAGTYDQAHHRKYATAILAALQAGNALNDAIDTWRQAAPGTPAPQIIATTIAGLQQIVTDLAGLLPADNPLLVDVNKVLAFIGPIVK